MKKKVKVKIKDIILKFLFLYGECIVQDFVILQSSDKTALSSYWGNEMDDDFKKHHDKFKEIFPPSKNNYSEGKLKYKEYYELLKQYKPTKENEKKIKNYKGHGFVIFLIEKGEDKINTIFQEKLNKKNIKIKPNVINEILNELLYEDVCLEEVDKIEFDGLIKYTVYSLSSVGIKRIENNLLFDEQRKLRRNNNILLFFAIFGGVVGTIVSSFFAIFGGVDTIVSLLVNYWNYIIN